MSQLPPPTARDVAGTPPVPRGPTPSAAAPPGEEWSWDRVRRLAEQWYRPLLDRRGWMALAYLFVGMVTGVGFFIAVAAIGSIVFGLMFVVVGFLLIGPAFRVVEALTGVERRLAGMVGPEIEPRPIAPITGVGWRAVTDPERWRQAGFLAANLVIAPTLLSIGTLAHSLVLQVISADPFIGIGVGWPLSEGSSGLVSLIVAALALGAAPRLAILVAGWKVRSTAWFLGPDRLAAAERRVTTLASQRQEILDAVATERRRIERNLHDGVQQQLVAIGLDLGMAEQHLHDDPERARQLMVAARHKVQGSIGELRLLGRGLHPAILADRGLDAALSAVIADAAIPIAVDVDADLDLSTDAAEIVYFVVNEAVANVLKHARARAASIRVAKVAANVRVVVHDDGVGGVDTSRGSGLAGIKARVHGVDGYFEVSSPRGGPTSIIAELPRHVPQRPQRPPRDRIGDG